MKSLIPIVQILVLIMLTIKNGITNAQLEVEMISDNHWNLIEINKNESHTIFTSETYILDIQWSHDQSYLAFQVRGKRNYQIYSKEELESKQLDPIRDHGHKLVVLDSEYQTIVEIPDVRIYRWSPNANEMVVITGYNTESGIGFMPEKTYVHNIPEKTSTFISDGPYLDIFWAQHDNCIYLNHNFKNGIEKYNPKTKVLNDTDFHGIYFSPSGEYYYTPSLEGSRFGIYKTSTNEPIQNISILNTEFLIPEGWLRDSDVLAVYRFPETPSKDKQSTFINVETGKSIKLQSQPKNQHGFYLPKEIWGDALMEKLNLIQ